MDDPNALDEGFRTAVAAIDTGNVGALRQCLSAQPFLVSARLEAPGAWLRDAVGPALDGFFKDPYLLWFIAEDPVRNGTLPSNIAEIARTIMSAAQRTSVTSLQEQFDYALKLVSWSWIARQSGVQIALIDVLADAGAALDGNPDNALLNGNVDAAKHLLQRGAVLTLSAAAFLERWADVERLASIAGAREKQSAFVLAALKGKTEALRKLLALGVDVNAVSRDLYSHGTPLHHAVHSGSLDAVRVLVEAGAQLGVPDTLFQSTPLGWAEISRGKPQYDEIAAYLRDRGATS
jgi:hypothetical protein